LVFGRNALEAFGISFEQAQAVEDDVRRRDLERLALQQAGGLLAGADRLLRKPRPEPLVVPARVSEALNPEAETIIRDSRRRAAQTAGS
jgi:CPA2 family monovalent cation:H+ antiporter-2